MGVDLAMDPTAALATSQEMNNCSAQRKQASHRHDGLIVKLVGEADSEVEKVQS
jgi:hypothetical protein